MDDQTRAGLIRGLSAPNWATPAFGGGGTSPPGSIPIPRSVFGSSQGGGYVPGQSAVSSPGLGAPHPMSQPDIPTLPGQSIAGGSSMGSGQPQGPAQTLRAPLDNGEPPGAYDAGGGGGGASALSSGLGSLGKGLSAGVQGLGNAIQAHPGQALAAQAEAIMGGGQPGAPIGGQQETPSPEQAAMSMPGVLPGSPIAQNNAWAPPAPQGLGLGTPTNQSLYGLGNPKPPGSSNFGLTGLGLGLG